MSTVVKSPFSFARGLSGRSFGEKERRQRTVVERYVTRKVGWSFIFFLCGNLSMVAQLTMNSFGNVVSEVSHFRQGNFADSGKTRRNESPKTRAVTIDMASVYFYPPFLSFFYLHDNQRTSRLDTNKRCPEWEKRTSLLLKQKCYVIIAYFPQCRLAISRSMKVVDFHWIMDLDSLNWNDWIKSNIMKYVWC